MACKVSGLVCSPVAFSCVFHHLAPLFATDLWCASGDSENNKQYGWKSKKFSFNSHEMFLNVLISFKHQSSMKDGMTDLVIEQPALKRTVFTGTDKVEWLAFVFRVRIDQADIGDCAHFKLA